MPPITTGASTTGATVLVTMGLARTGETTVEGNTDSITGTGGATVTVVAGTVPLAGFPGESAVGASGAGFTVVCGVTVVTVVVTGATVVTGSQEQRWSQVRWW